jgi:hypothetical protein
MKWLTAVLLFALPLIAQQPPRDVIGSVVFANRGETPAVSKNANGATEFVFDGGTGLARYWGPDVSRMCIDE